MQGFLTMTYHAKYRDLLVIIGLFFSGISFSQVDLKALENILDFHCAECHGDENDQEGEFSSEDAGIDYITDLQELVQEGLVIPYNPDGSILFQRLITPNTKERMPKRRPPLASEEIQLVKDWILTGAINNNTQKSHSSYSFSDIVDAIKIDLENSPKSIRQYSRYFYATDLENFEKIANSLSLGVNSLSLAEKIEKPIVVERELGLLKINLSSFPNLLEEWTELENIYPYFYDTIPFTAIKQATQSNAPLFNISWFIKTAFSPKIYYKLLQLPDNFQTLEAELGTDTARNYQTANPFNKQIVRAGFLNSGVSVNNRIIERQETKHGVLWSSYDFAASLGEQYVLERPLGPNEYSAYGSDQLQNFVFSHDGGEFIFSLENGLNAYYISDAKGQRLDVAPTNIVFDNVNNEAVKAGISCFACHQNGIISKKDDIIPLYSNLKEKVGAKILSEISRLYPGQNVLDSFFNKDNKSYNQALIATWLFPKNIGNFFKVADSYVSELNIQQVAQELFVSVPTIENLKFEFTKNIKNNIDFLIAGGKITRQQFESLFSELFIILNKIKLNLSFEKSFSDLRLNLNELESDPLTFEVHQNNYLKNLDLQLTITDPSPGSHEIIFYSGTNTFSAKFSANNDRIQNFVISLPPEELPSFNMQGIWSVYIRNQSLIQGQLRKFFINLKLQ